MTPEGRVKEKIKAVLDNYGSDLYRYMPVPHGYGEQSLDFIGCVHGVFFAIEAKRPGKHPTPRQEATIERMQAAGARVFVIRDEAGCKELEEWLQRVVFLSHETRNT